MVHETARTLVLVPTYQEADNIGSVLCGIRSAIPDCDVLVIDDDSPDGTAAVVESIAAGLGKVELLRHGAKAGLGSAYRAGFAVAFERGHDVIVQMDADLSHDPAALPTLLAGIERGAVMAVGSRYVDGGAIPNWPWHRRALSRYGNRYASFAIRLPMADATSGFRAYRAEVARDIDVLATEANGYGFLIELAYRVSRRGAPIVEVPIVFTDRARGTSKMSWRIVAEAMWLVTRWGIRDRLSRSRERPIAPGIERMSGSGQGSSSSGKMKVG